MKQLQIYDFNLAAGASMNLPVQGAYVRVISCTGNVNIIADTFGKLGPISRGQGLQNSEYNRLTIQDASGAPNSGTILVSESDFIDQTLYGSIALAGAVALDSATLAALEQTSTRPELSTGYFNNTAALVANTPVTVFTPAANVNGAILLRAFLHQQGVNTGGAIFIAKSSAPASIADGELIFGSSSTAPNGAAAAFNCTGFMNYPQSIAAGLGLYLISQDAQGAAVGTSPNQRACSYRLL